MSTAFGSDLKMKSSFDTKLELLNSYIPFSETEDNCFYRRDYIALEFLELGLNPYEVYIINQDDELMVASTGDKWRWHTTIGLKVDDEFWVIDPSFSNDLITLTDWEEEVNINKNDVKVLYSSENNNIDINTSDCRSEDKYANNPFREHAETAFNFISDGFPVMCAYMFTDIEKENISDYDKKIKKNVLIKRSKELLQFALEEGLTEVNPDGLEAGAESSFLDLEEICRKGIEPH
jgi:hypothetical protein